MKKIILYGPFVLVFLMFLGFNKNATEFHWSNIIEKIVQLGGIILIIYLIKKFYDTIGKNK